MQGQTPDQVLDELGRTAHLVAADEVDRCIADQLKVPLEYYFAYLVVSRALERHRAEPSAAPARSLRSARHAAGRAGWLAARIYRSCAEATTQTPGVASDSAAILDAVLLLQEAHDNLDELIAEWSAS